jgi:excisionase family DNA binding protein
VILQPRLLSPDEAATYLGLGSRWAIYRLVGHGELPVIRLAGKLRLDRDDLDRLIETRKGCPRTDSEPRVLRSRRPGSVLQILAPWPAPSRRRRPVTTPVTGVRAGA